MARIVYRGQKSAPEVSGALLKSNSELSRNINPKVEVLLEIPESRTSGLINSCIVLERLTEETTAPGTMQYVPPWRA